MIRWITDQLATGAHDDVPGDAPWRVVDVRDLVDKAGNLPDAVRAKIEEAEAGIAAGARVVICCDYGMSRSNAIAAGVLARMRSVPFDDAVRYVLEATEEPGIKVEVLAAVRTAIGHDAGVAARNAQAIRVLITGAGGFIGQHLAARLGEQLPVATPVRTEVDLLKGGVPLELAVRKCEATHIVHLASPRVYTVADAMGTSLTMLKNVIDACGQHGLKLVFLSSWEVFSGYATTGIHASESLPPYPRGTYGETKFLSEVLLRHHAECDALQLLVVRSSPVYGPDSDRPKFIHNFLGQARRGADIQTHRYRNGYPHLDLLHVSDLVEGVNAAITGDASGICHFGTGTLTSTAEIAFRIVDLTGSSSRVLHRDIDADAPNIAMDTSRARREFGWSPRITLAEGLRDLVDRSARPEPTRRGGIEP